MIDQQSFQVEDKGLERISASACKTLRIADADESPGAYLVQWADIRPLIAACEDLPLEVRQRMTSIGDSSTENTLPTPIAKPFNEFQTDRNS